MRQLLGNGRLGRWVPGALARHYIPEQRQTVEYVRRWYHGAGQGHSLQPSVRRPSLFGRPLWLWRQAIQSEVLYRIRRHLAPPRAWLGDLRLAGVSWGRIQGYRRSVAR